MIRSDIHSNALGIFIGFFCGIVRTHERRTANSTIPIAACLFQVKQIPNVFLKRFQWEQNGLFSRPDHSCIQQLLPRDCPTEDTNHRSDACARRPQAQGGGRGRRGSRDAAGISDGGGVEGGEGVAGDGISAGTGGTGGHGAPTGGISAGTGGISAGTGGTGVAGSSQRGRLVAERVRGRITSSRCSGGVVCACRIGAGSCTCRWWHRCRILFTL